MDLPLAEIPDLTFQITCPVEEDVTESAQDFGRCVWRTQSSPVDVRMKRLFKSNGGCQNILDDTVVAQELVKWHKVRHPNTVSVFGTFHRDLAPFLITPWMTDGNLNVFLMQRHQYLSSVDRMSLIRDVAEGLHCLHSFSIVHGNLIGANILIDNGRTACITDFGLASVRGPILGSAFLGTSGNSPGAIRWAATELITKDVEPRRPTIHSDIYSFGSVALQISTGKVPWSELEDEFDVCVKLSQGLVPSKPEDCRIKDTLWAFIQRCWEFVPQDLPTSINALDFVEIEFRAMLSTYTVKGLIDDSPVVADRGRYSATQPLQGTPSEVSACSSALENNSTSILSSPEPSRVVPSAITAYSQRSSVLAQGVYVRDGVTAPWNNVGSGRPGSGVFVDDASAPLSPTPASTPAIKTEVIESFETVPATSSNYVNRNFMSVTGSSKQPARPSLSPPPNTSTITSNPATSTASTPKPIINKADIAKRFQNPSVLSSQPFSDTSSPSTRPSNLLPHHQPSSSTSQPPPQPSQLGTHSYTPFVPGARRPQQGATPRSPAFPPAMPNIPNQSRGPPPIPASPRMGSSPHQALSNGAPQVPVQPMQWGGYYQNGPHSAPSHQPGPLPMSRGPAAPPLPGTPTMAHAVTPPPHHGQGSGFGSSSVAPALGSSFELVVPLEVPANRCVPVSAVRKVRPGIDTPEIVDRKVKALLNKLTMERFDSISDQIIQLANKSVDEKDGRTLIQVIRLVFEKATNGAAWSEICARLCRKMMEQISPDVQDDGIKNPEGKPIAGGLLFRKYLLNRCQEDFERGWFAKEATTAAAAAKASDDQATKAADENKDTEKAGLYSDKYFVAQKARRQGLGLITFIGELFKLQMLTECIMHECVKKLLGSAEIPEEKEIESLCQLLKTVGQLLDTQKARAHMDVYFTRMKELGKSTNVSSRIQSILQDVTELRERKWVSRNAIAAPMTIAAVHEAAARDRLAAEKESFNRQASMSRGGSRRGGERNQEFDPDGWAVAGGSVSQPPPNPKASDLSQFGKISKGAPMVIGPSSVFAGGKKDIKRESLSRTSSSSNMFHMLGQNPELVPESSTKPSCPTSRTPSIDLGQAGVPEYPVQRKKLQLLPRFKPTIEDNIPYAKKKVFEDMKEFFAVRNLEEADVYFTDLPHEHRFRLVDKLVASALESKEADARLVGEFFARAMSNGQCTMEILEEGFTPMAECLDDIAIDAPKAFDYMAIMLKGAGFETEPERLERIASKLEDSNKLVSLVA